MRFPRPLSRLRPVGAPVGTANPRAGFLGLRKPAPLRLARRGAWTRRVWVISASMVASGNIKLPARRSKGLPVARRKIGRLRRTRHPWASRYRSTSGRRSFVVKRHLSGKSGENVVAPRVEAEKQVRAMA